MNEELYLQLLKACAVYSVQYQYDAAIRNKLDFIAEKRNDKTRMFYELHWGKAVKLKELYEKKIKEELDPAIANANLDIDKLSQEEKTLWKENQRFLDFLPEKYRSEIAVTYMMLAVKNCRADTLKEAINLFENACDQWRIEKILADTAKMNRLQYEHMAQATREIEQNQEKLHYELQCIRYNQENNNT